MAAKQRRNPFLSGTGLLGRVAVAAGPVCVIAVMIAGRARADDWPTYRHDAARSGVTSEKISLPLKQCWVFKARHAPRPAWGDPKPEPVEDILELRRVHFDDVFQPVAAGGAVYFGSSANNKVYCLDAASGRIRWTRITGGPVRLAPWVAGGRLFVGSDDGHAYCLGAEDGALRWKFRAAPEDRRLLGHGKMISLWPLRCGLLVDRSVAYFSAGIFPAEGVFIYAVDAESGREIWRNNTCSEAPQSRVSPQGYLLASETTLYAPMGRVSPAAFDRGNGRLLQETFFGKRVGGTFALLAGEHVYTGTEQLLAYKRRSRDRFAHFAGRKMVVAEDTAYLATGTELVAMRRTKNPAASIRWKIPCRRADSLILAGGVLIAGGAGEVAAVDAAAGRQIWTADIEGTAKGLAVAAGRLLVSTDKGMIYCFASPKTPNHGTITEAVEENPFADSPTAAIFARATETIFHKSGAKKGYCLVLGLETGQLALELARRSELMIYALSPDAEKVAAARRALDAAGVYGARVCVEQRPLEKVPYADYFANLIVSETALTSGRLPPEAAEMFRMLKPIGGTAVIGQPAQRVPGAKPLKAETLRQWFKAGGLEGVRVTADGGTWATITRGPLPGAGSWTHQYAEVGNTACSDDTRVKCPLELLWFGRPGPGKMVNRHARAAGPLCLDGRLFVQGENVLMAYDAYNGVKLWQRDIPGALRTTASHDSSNLALSRQGLFVAIGDRCLRLEPATGKTLATYHVPPAPDGRPRRWGYVACVGKLLLGSRTAGRGHSDCLFAVDLDSGEQPWVYRAKRIPHNSVAIGDGSVFLVHSDVTGQQRQQAIDERRARLKDLPQSQRAKAEKSLAKADVRMVVALDVRSAAVQWKRPMELTNCGGFHAGTPNYPAILSAMYNRGVLVLFGVYLDGHYWQQFFSGQFDSRRIAALSGKDGSLLWSRSVGFRVRPLIVGDTLHAEPWAFDLRSGQQKIRIHPLTGRPDAWQFARPGHHCGCPAASPNCLFFRSWNLGYYDLLGDYGTMHFGGQRPGCWINFLPAGGLLLMPEASAGCMCAFPHMCSVALKPAAVNKAWAWYSAPGPTTPVERLAINFGAAGDRKDAAGKLWLGYPRPRGSLVLQLKMDSVFYPGGRFVTGNSVYTRTAGTEEPWLFASAAAGLRKCVIPLLGKDDRAASYQVRLAFAEAENDRPGRRVFDIKLQGKPVQKDFDVVEVAGGGNRAVLRQFDGVEVVDNLVIELVAKSDRPQPNQWPIIQGIEIVRTR